jgi:cytoskeletal protein RodZ
MMQWRMILAVVIVALGAAAIWAWQEGSQRGDATLAHAVPAAPVQQPQPPAADQVVVSDSSPTPTSLPQAEPSPVASNGTQTTTSAAVEPPNVDTPEPAQQKFARGGRAEPDQN